VTYDSRPDTLAHIRRVQELLADVQANLLRRAIAHDMSKLESPEVEVFDRETSNLRAMIYGSDEYKASLVQGLQHHYANNSHHPEHYPNGIRGMSLLDLIEMLVDWKAATERHADGDLLRSIEQNQERFGYTDELKDIFLRTVEELF